MSFKKIDHINVVVRDLDAAKRFFLDLGFVVMKEGELEGEWIDNLVKLSGVKAGFVVLSIPGTQTNIELIKYFSPEGQNDPKLGTPNQIGFRHIAIEVNDINMAVSNLKNSGVTFFSGIQTYNIKRRMCYFSGPEGIIIELVEQD
jgi:catechol 2,3-dioxygenase-like lactoylglutathione lyase family enzyme